MIGSQIQVTTNVYISLDDAYGLDIQGDGKIVIAGTSYDLVKHRMVFMRFNTNGSVDNSFATAGILL